MNTWEFWIDVGGTFTDCIGRTPEGRFVQHKTLSSGVVRGTIEAGSDRQQVVDSRRRVDPPDFWMGWNWLLLNADGHVVVASKVTSFDANNGVLTLADPLPFLPPLGATYELTATLEAPIVAIRYLLKCPLTCPLPRLNVRLGTTRGTNALLTRRGGRVAWLTTPGLGDVLRIGYQTRPDLFALNIQLPAPLYETVREIPERLAADGSVLEPLNRLAVDRVLRELQSLGIESLAIGLLHSYRNPTHEHLIASRARELGFRHVSCSSDVAALRKLVPRGDTTLVDAYLQPVLEAYIAQLTSDLSSTDEDALRLMTSAGGLVTPRQFRGKDSVLSGPAGGVIGFAAAAQAAGFTRAIGFDMGGTSTDVARYDGRLEREFETEKAGVRLVVPTLAIETVAAGGGSIVHFDGMKLVIGPGSAGADPGPACYGRRGPLTVTDLNVYLGRIPLDAFPMPLHVDHVEQRLAELQALIECQIGRRLSLVELAEGGLRIANANMAQAIRSISIAKGYRPQDYVLVSFGGAAPQHACAVARQLRIGQILDHPDASLLSALGIGLAEVARHADVGVYRSWEDFALNEDAVFAPLEHRARGEVAAAGVALALITTHRALDLRYHGTETPITIDHPDDRDFAKAFQEAHRRRYGYAWSDRPVEVVAARVEAVGRRAWSLPPSAVTAPRQPRPAFHQLVYFDGKSQRTPVYRRSELQPGDTFCGPALVVHTTSTAVILPGWRSRVLTQGELLLNDEHPVSETLVATECDPIELEVFHGLFESIARQMGITLRNTAMSVNVKERLDFSCAVFTAAGDLVVNAPHIPVHLGAMSETVRCVLEDVSPLRPGDVIITNDPLRGGSHLPDVTVITPVFDATGSELRFFVANRAHHAEIGGICPGSMSPAARNLAEEGVLLRSFRLIDQGVPQWEKLIELLTQAPYPSREVEANLADVRAQIAANQQGVEDLQQLERQYSWPVVRAYMGHIQSSAEVKTRQVLKRLPDGEFEFTDHLDDGARLQVRITLLQGSARIDFTGSAPVQTSNFNANPAIVTAAVLYVLRCLINEPIPLNQGVLRPVTLIIPPGLLNPTTTDSLAPRRCPPMSGGNVETSQRLVDVLLGALKLAAASQGTMNNVLFGNSSFGYYETICGGAGATQQARGASAVHTHMTNTRLTDPEVLESRYPIRLRQFRVRSDSGGQGQHAGGDGVEREFEFLATLDLSILSQRRGPFAPYGLDGGTSGALGENRLIRSDGTEQVLGACFQGIVSAGDRLIIRTPGGGGYGTP